MGAVFDVAVADSVTYYWKMVYSLGGWSIVGLVSQEQAVNGGPTYGVPLTWSSALYEPDGNTTDVGQETRPRVQASYYNTNGDGCPGIAFLRTRFTRGNGLTASYKVESRGVTILRGLIRRGSATDTPAPSLPPGGNPDACLADEDGIIGGNTT